MLELMARTNPASPSLDIDNDGRGYRQPGWMRSLRCPVCHGGKGRHTCTRCNGTGRMFATGGQTSTRRSYVMPEMSPGDIESLLIGLPQKKVDAARWLVLADMAAYERLRLIIARQIYREAVRDWTDRVKDKEAKSWRLAELALFDFARSEIVEPDRGQYARAFGLSRSQWNRNWHDRMRVYVSLLAQWTADVDGHMWRRWQDDTENVA